MKTRVKYFRHKPFGRNANNQSKKVEFNRGHLMGSVELYMNDVFPDINQFGILREHALTIVNEYNTFDFDYVDRVYYLDPRDL